MNQLELRIFVISHISEIFLASDCWITKTNRNSGSILLDFAFAEYRIYGDDHIIALVPIQSAFIINLGSFAFLVISSLNRHHFGVIKFRRI